MRLPVGSFVWTKTRPPLPLSADAQPQGYPDTIVHRFPPAAESGVRTVELNQADVAVSISPPATKQELERLALRYPRIKELVIPAAATSARPWQN